MNAEKRLSVHVIEKIQEEISEAGGNEVLAVGRLGIDGLVEGIVFAARGSEDQVPALYPHMEQGDVVIHNHPSGRLAPSAADMGVASKLGNEGIGFFIVDNRVTEVYPVAEPVVTGEYEELDPEELGAVLSETGPLADSLPDYEPREEQQLMLQAVGRAFNGDRISVIEAGTGVGKSFAYLIPAVLWAGKNGERIIISTHTINLQQQIFEKDLPAVMRYTGVRLKTVLAKGRGNYLCLRKMRDALAEPDLFDEFTEDLQAVSRWAEQTRNGSRTDLPFYATNQLWQSVCSESDTCLGLRCPDRERCFVLRARKDAAGANIIVVNHHLLFSDLSMRLDETGFETTAVLPPCKRFIYDEAHTMEASATSFFSRILNRFLVVKQLNRLVRRRAGRVSGLLRRIKNMYDGFSEMDKIDRLVSEVLQKYDALEASAALLLGEGKNLRIRSLAEDGSESVLKDPLVNFHQAVLLLATELTDVMKNIPEEHSERVELFELGSVLGRFETIAVMCKDFLECGENQTDVFWLEKSRNFSGEIFYNIYITPASVAPIMREAVFEPNKTVVCTSATLAISARFDYWMRQVGLAGFDPERVERNIFSSPFPYESNVLLTVPQDAPLPQEEEYISYCSRTVSDILDISEGRGLVLFTSYRMLEEVYGFVSPRLREKKITCMKQGDEDRAKLLKNFNSDTASVLFATDSFWQGIDAPGETLSVLVIARLPFRVPTDPVVKARMELLEQRGRNPFFEMSVPEAVMKLKQGFGRLVRKRSDGGVVVILDSRIIKKRYGKFFLDSLPKTALSFKDTAHMMEDIELFLYS